MAKSKSLHIMKFKSKQKIFLSIFRPSQLKSFLRKQLTIIKLKLYIVLGLWFTNSQDHFPLLQQCLIFLTEIITARIAIIF